jgi:hypothetical protein
VVLQASESEPCIRHAIIAIGALDFKDWAAWNSKQNMANARRQLAYREYHRQVQCFRILYILDGSLTVNRAILALKRGIKEERTNLRTRILACVLFACFESYHGNKNEAVCQIFAGTEMVGEYLRIKAAEERSNATLSRPGLEESIYMAFAVVEVQALAIGARKRYNYHFMQ